MRSLALTVNGRRVKASVEPRTHLADFLRESQSLTGTHLGCEHGVCGACTILIDGVPARSCITWAVACEGASVTTIEGLEDDEVAAELREAFSREHALQCGYCTPGMLVSARDVVLRLPEPDEHAIRVAMSGNLCRCTGYVGIVRAVQGVVAARRARGIAPLPGGGRSVLGPVGAHPPEARGAEPARTALGPVPGAPVAAGRPEHAGTGLDAPERESWRPQVTLEQHFVVRHPPERVWDFFGRVAEVAACLPGASLTAEPTDRRAEGRMRVKAGPIVAEFAGVADISRDVAHYSGIIRGQGRDARSGSATRGEVAYQLTPAEGGAATRVDVTVGYTLTGALAQFGRSGLVRDIAGRLTASFAQNLEARLNAVESGGELPPPAEVPALRAGSLLWAVLRDRLRALLRGRLQR